MKTTVNQVQIGDKIPFGWNQVLTVTKIEKSFQKNGKELTIFTGDSEKAIYKGKGWLKPLISEPLKDYKVTYKSLTKIQTL